MSNTPALMPLANTAAPWGADRRVAWFIVTQAYLPLISFVVGMLMWGTTLVQYFLYRNRGI